VKYLSRDAKKYLFLVGARERQLMLKLLRQYPVLSTSYHTSSKNQKGAKAAIDPELLEEALAEQQKELKTSVEKMLKQPARFKKHNLGYVFTVKETEMEWLLQVFNDIRVGSWVKLGSPRPEKPLGLEISEATIELAWAMEMAGLFEHTLLEAMDRPE
jgi:hypothetical protein